MPRQAWAVVFALCASWAAFAAPVPPPRLVTAEAVLKPPGGNPREVAAKLASAPFLSGVVKSRPAAQATLRYECDPAGWLGSRLKPVVDPDRGTVTLRLVDCPRKDAVALLSAVVAAYKADLLGLGHETARLREKELLVRLLIAQQLNAQAGGGAAQMIAVSNFGLATAGPSKAEVEASVVRAPRVVEPGLPGQAGSPR
jgi:hypothetical protein